MPDSQVSKCARCRETKPVAEFYSVIRRGKRQPFGYCKDCARIKTREYRLGHPQYGPAWAAEHRDKRLAQKRARRAAQPEANLRASLRYLHNLPLEEFQVMEAAQSERCAICRRQAGTGRNRLQVDHDHRTGRIRGLLCGSCNRAMGLFGEDPQRLLAAFKYLGIIALAEAIGA